MSESNHRGFVTVPSPREEIFGTEENLARTTKVYTVDELSLKNESALVTEARKFVKAESNLPTFNHSERAFLLGRAIAETHFPDHQLDLESFYLASLFHDIGCSEKNLHATKMSFEYYGGIIARDWLLEHGADRDLADSVGETIFRHTDFVTGKVTLHGQIIQLATLLDNLGGYHNLVSDETYSNIVSAFHRDGWSACFADTMQTELDLKPWSHTTSLLGHDFVNAARGNKYGAKFGKD